jgi:hypothetical protein
VTRAEWALTGVVAFALLYAAIVLVVWSRRRHSFDREAMERQQALDALPPEPVDDPCVTEGCGHARGDHYQRLDRSRGACLDKECSCVRYVPDRPMPVLLGVPQGFLLEEGPEGVVYDHEEEQ